MLPSQRGFKLASLNINKLITHIDQLRILLAHNELDILSINQTKLNETIQPRPQGLLAFQYGGSRREDPGTQQKSRD